MKVHFSDLKLREIIYTNKENLLDRFFKLQVEGTDYVIQVNHIDSRSIQISVYGRKRFMDANKPIEKNYNKKIKRIKNMYTSFFDDGISPKYFINSIENLISNYQYEFYELNEQTNSFLHDLKKKDELFNFTSEIIKYKEFEESKSKLYEKLSNFLKNISVNQIKNDETLKKDAIKLYLDRVKEEKEVEEHMKKVREWERRSAESYIDEKEYIRKNAQDYNIRW